MFKSLIAFASAQPLISAATGLTLLVGTGVGIAVFCPCSDGEGAGIVSVAHAGEAEAEAAPKDASGKDCDKPCPYSKSAATTTATADAGEAAEAPKDTSDKDCHKSCAGAAYEGEYAESDIVEMKDAKVGSLVRCPMSGVVFQVTENSPKQEIDGKTVFTCCGNCSAKLEAAKEA